MRERSGTSDVDGEGELEQADGVNGVKEAS